jgi:hypothetical protein
MCEDFTLNFGGKRTGCCVTTTRILTLSFPQENFDQHQHNLLFSVCLIEDET